VTPYYERYPLVLVRLSAIPDEGLRDLLAMSRRLTLGKTRAPITSSESIVPLRPGAGVVTSVPAMKRGARRASRREP